MSDLTIVICGKALTQGQRDALRTHVLEGTPTDESCELLSHARAFPSRKDLVDVLMRRKGSSRGDNEAINAALSTVEADQYSDDHMYDHACQHLRWTIFNRASGAHAGKGGYSINHPTHGARARFADPQFDNLRDGAFQDGHMGYVYPSTEMAAWVFPVWVCTPFNTYATWFTPIVPRELGRFMRAVESTEGKKRLFRSITTARVLDTIAAADGLGDALRASIRVGGTSDVSWSLSNTGARVPPPAVPGGWRDRRGYKPRDAVPEVPALDGSPAGSAGGEDSEGDAEGDSPRDQVVAE